MKKSILIALCFSLLVCLTSCGDTHANTSSDVPSESTLSFETFSDGSIQVTDGSHYTLLEDGTLAFSLTVEAVDVVVPAESDGKTVTELKQKAFVASKKTLRSVTLPDTIRDIGSEVFRGCELLSHCCS